MNTPVDPAGATDVDARFIALYDKLAQRKVESAENVKPHQTEDQLAGKY